MKIFFEDGSLKINNGISLVEEQAPIIVEADWGITNNLRQLNSLRVHEELSEKVVVYTNSILAFDNKYAWNAELEVPEIYIRTQDRGFVRIDELTDRKLCKSNKLLNLYLAGEFVKGEMTYENY